MNKLCECPVAGFCNRHRVQKNTRQHELCRGINCKPEQSKKYWDAGEAGLLPGQPAAVEAPKKFQEGSKSFGKPLTERKSRLPGTPVISPGGVGTELKAMIGWFGISASSCSLCKQRALIMDSKGVEWCEQHVDTIVTWLGEGARKRGLVGWLASNVPGFDFGAKQVVLLAIENAKKKYRGKLRLKSKFPPLVNQPIDRERLKSHILYHVMPVAGETEWVWRRHIAWLKEVRHQFTGRVIIGIVTAGPGDHFEYCPPSAVREACEGLGAEFIEAPNDVRGNPRRGIGEGVLFPSMIAKLETQDPDDVIFYGHCKGVTRPGPVDSVPNRWAEAMFDTTFRNYDDVISLLDYSGVCGPFLMRGGFRAGMPGLGPYYFYSGTFFALRSVDVFKRNWRTLTSYYGCVEQFPRHQFLIDAEASCIFHNNAGNLYDENEWKNRIEPELTKWRSCKTRNAKSLSIVIPTLGRESLARVLNSLVEQTGERDEIVIVADGQEAETRVHAIVSNIYGNIRVMCHQDPRSRFGSAQRNHGASQATGEWIWFVDDDDIVPDDALNLVKSTVTDKPVIFRMQHESKVIWEERIAKDGNVSAQMLVAPNRPGIPQYPISDRYTGDNEWINAVIDSTEVEWSEKVIYALQVHNLGV